MKPILNRVKWSAVLALLLLAAGCATAKHEEAMLTAAGFKAVVAATPAQEQKLKALPPGKITRTQRHGKTYYVFPDVAHNQIYLGTPREYQTYQQMVLDNKIAVQDRVAADLGEDEGGDWNDWGDWEILSWQPQ